jgi:ABC-2 type transport system permease protein
MDQLRALLWLRWLEFKYSFRSREGVWGILGALIVAAILAPAALGLGAAGFFFVWRLQVMDQYRSLFLIGIELLLAANFFAFQMTNLFDPRRHEGVDLRRLQIFPIPLYRLHRLNLAASINDAVFLFFVPMQWGLAAGAIVTLGWRAAGWLAALGLFSVLNLCWSQAIAMAIGSVMQARRRKEFLVLLLPLLALAVYWLPYWWLRTLPEAGRGKWEEDSAAIVALLDFLPSGWTFRVLEAVSQGRSWWLQAALLASASLAGYWLSLWLLRRSLAGREGSGRRTVKNLEKGVRSRAFALPGRVGALLEKDFRYLLRSSQGRYAFVWPVILTLLLRIFALQSEANRQFLEMVEGSQLLFFIGFFFFFFLPFYVGPFGFDHRGVQTYYLAPVSFRKVLLAKNLAVFILGGVCSLELLACYIVLFGWPGASAVFLAALGMAAGFPILFAGGNLVGCYFPKALKVTSLRGNNPPQAAVFLGMLLVAVASAIVIFAAILGGFFHWGLGVLFEAVVLAISLGVYALLLGPAARLYESRKEGLIQALARREVQE